MTSSPTTAQLPAGHTAESDRTNTGTAARSGSITLSDEGQARVVTLTGDIDATLRDQASLVLASIATSPIPVVVELSAVTSIDSAGIAFVLQLANLEEEQQMPILLRGASKEVFKILEDLGIDSRFIVTD